MTNEASAESSHRMGSATSSTSAMRWMGMVAATAAWRAGSATTALVMSVRVMPGRTALTRTPCAATSLARPMVKTSTAAFDAA